MVSGCLLEDLTGYPRIMDGNRGNRLSKWIGELIKNKTNNAGLTFAALHQLATNGNFRNLYITGTNLFKQQAVVFSYETYPQMKVKDAVRISVSIPFFFKALAIDSPVIL